MNKSIEIDTDTLQSWLEEGQVAEVIDVRRRADFAAWHIPGSRHVAAYEAIQNRLPGPLADYQAPDGGRVVAVCYVGQTSLAAARYLRSRGIKALSLTGGMEGWSLAWNTADVTTRNGAQVVQFRRTGKGCLSYLVASGGEAAVIDPSLDPDHYLALSARRGWRITRVLDTHVHADHLTRGPRLASKAGAAYYLPANDRVAAGFYPLQDGDVIALGQARLKAIRTPGHTFEAMSFLLDGETLFSGDTLFLDSVGRPDLKADRSESEARARALYRTLQALRTLDPGTQILPGHTSQPVPFDRVPLAAPLARVMAQITAPDLGAADFVAWILGRLPPNPPHYEAIVRLNERGVWPASDVIGLEAGPNRCAV